MCRDSDDSLSVPACHLSRAGKSGNISGHGYLFYSHNSIIKTGESKGFCLSFL